MLPKYRRLVERLAQAGLLKVICGTDTLGVGINVPIRTVVFTALSKYDGQRVRTLSAREFHQIAGRAGRAGFDIAGAVVVQAPEHVIETERALAKAGDDPKLRRKVVRKKPPERFVSWGEPTFARLVAAPPEPLTSSFAVSHAMVLNVVARPGDAFAAMRHLLTDNHESRPAQRRHIRRAIAIYRALLAAGVIERLDHPDADGRRVRLTVDLQVDFALNQPLSPFAVEALTLLDRESPTYALDVLSIVEATLDNPGQILAAQQHKARGEAIAQMKADGIEYEERMTLLDSVTLPEAPGRPPRRRLRRLPPGPPLGRRLPGGGQVGGPRPLRTGHDLRRLRRPLQPGPLRRPRAALPVRRLQGPHPDRPRGRQNRRALRPHRMARRTGPPGRLQPPRRMGTAQPPRRRPAARAHGAAGRCIVQDGPPPVTANTRAFRVLVRNELFRRVELAALRRYDTLGELDGDAGWTEQRWHDALAGYFADHADIGTGPDARGPALIIIDVEPGRWRVRQILDDPAGDHDWGISADVDLAASDAAGTAVVRITAVERL